MGTSCFISFAFVQAATSALLAVGAGVGDVFPFLRPGHAVAPFRHFLDKGFLVRAALHGFANVIHQLEFSAFAADGRPVFSCTDLRAALLVRLQGGEAVGSTDLIVEFP